jgi:2-amino-4-hydroxy-6-hydroxymethyldihydropteridine diphosphokinase
MIFLGLGSNLGDREDFLRQAVSLLAENPKIKLCGASAIYETEPYGVAEQPAFLNMAVAIDTDYTLKELLGVCQKAEGELFRERSLHWGPRTLDIDILAAEDAESNLPDLVVPHPYLTRRRFVLVPLSELAADFCVGGRTVREHLDDCEDRGAVRLYKKF